MTIVGGIGLFFIVMIIVMAMSKEKNELPAFSTEYDKTYLLGQFDPSERSDFSKIDRKYTTKTGIYMRTEAYYAFIDMYSAAKADGVELTIISATRNFNSQKAIWESKWNGQRKVNGMNLAEEVDDPVERAYQILLYSSMPGTSRHHWGTDIDMNSLENSYFASGEGLNVYEWLTANAADYGFYLVYTAKGESRPNGYEEEKWHWTYLPLSWEMLQQYTNLITHSDISGFDGDESAETVNMIDNYVMGINPVCIEYSDVIESFYAAR